MFAGRDPIAIMGPDINYSTNISFWFGAPLVAELWHNWARANAGSWGLQTVRLALVARTVVKVSSGNSISGQSGIFGKWHAVARSSGAEFLGWKLDTSDTPLAIR
jgi:hypothetical protein